MLEVTKAHTHTHTHTNLLNGELLTVTVIEVGRVVACLDPRDGGGERRSDQHAVLTVSEL